MSRLMIRPALQPYQRRTARNVSRTRRPRAAPAARHRFPRAPGQQVARSSRRRAPADVANAMTGLAAGAVAIFANSSMAVDELVARFSCMFPSSLMHLASRSGGLRPNSSAWGARRGGVDHQQMNLLLPTSSTPNRTAIQLARSAQRPTEQSANRHVASRAECGLTLTPSHLTPEPRHTGDLCTSRRGKEVELEPPASGWSFSDPGDSETPDCPRPHLVDVELDRVFGTPACKGTVEDRPDEPLFAWRVLFRRRRPRPMDDAVTKTDRRRLAVPATKAWDPRASLETGRERGQAKSRTRKHKDGCILLRPDLKGGIGCARDRSRCSSALNR